MIFTERTVRVNNDKSTINAPVILYRGDKNIEIRFELLESPYKYSNKGTVNIIETTDASYGQLVIKTPNDEPAIFSDIVETQQSHIIFTITYDMIDEVKELGAYDFQIRLFDANQNSRATIPEIIGGIIVKEPIASEDMTNNVTNSTTVGNAIVTNDVNIPTFVGGKYNKTDWNNGDIISKQKLNKMEEGIYETYELGISNSSQIKEKANVINVSNDPQYDVDNIGVAINNCINKSIEGDIIVLDSGNYKLRNNIIINKNITINLNGFIDFTSSDSIAVKVTSKCILNVRKISTNNLNNIAIELSGNVYHGEFNIDQIINFKFPLALRPNYYNGDHIEGIQYCKFNFNSLIANKKEEGSVGIIFEPGDKNVSWINENTFIGGRIIGHGGLKTIKSSTMTDKFNNNKFYNIGFEDIVADAIDLEFSMQNAFENLRFELIGGLYIRESSNCECNRYNMSQSIQLSKVNIEAKYTVINANILGDLGTLFSNNCIFNFSSNNDLQGVNYHSKFSNTNPELSGISICEKNKKLYERFGLIFTDELGVDYPLPCKEIRTKHVDNIDFKMDALYKCMTILSQNNAVTITIPNIFKYDGAEFIYSTNWCSNSITFIDEDNVEQFVHEGGIDNIGTYKCIFFVGSNKFKRIKISDNAF